MSYADDSVPDIDADADERRDWRRPTQPEKVVDLIAHFASMTAGAQGPVLMSSSPSWFDDVSFAPIQSVHLGGENIVAGAHNYWSTEGDGEHELTREAQEHIERSEIPNLRPILSQAFEAMKANGPLGRNLVEEAIHPLEPEEIVSFMRIPSYDGAPARVLVAITHSNGWTDVAYEADAEGRLTVWNPAGFEESLKDDTVPTEFSLPKLPAATIVESPAPGPARSA